VGHNRFDQEYSHGAPIAPKRNLRSTAMTIRAMRSLYPGNRSGGVSLLHRWTAGTQQRMLLCIGGHGTDP